MALYRKAECADAALASPKAGQSFDYLLLASDGKPDRSMARRQTLRAVSGDLVDYSEALIPVGKDSFPPEPRQVRMGILPTTILGGSVRYEGAAAAMEGLRPGTSAEIPITETRAGSPPKPAVATLTFVGCGLSEPIVVGAANEPVRVFHVKLPYSTSEKPGEFTRMIDTEFLVSQSRGWPIAERTPSGTLVLVANAE
ncbi:hypothetical protein CSW64_12130 [Caulobacter mirabilis]|uniref:Uncharacterized protein n=1 Tax=Caulobacter mirabilis TaxID=69666 RepID=A0A2D2AYV7_9CAUL|nr:hypothetical protein CSW64_12130 [Caulobacter mirabilis]